MPVRLNIFTGELESIPTAGAVGGVTGGANVNVDGVGVFDGQIGTTLNFRGIKSESAGLTAALDAVNKTVDLTLVSSAITLDNITQITTRLHASLQSLAADDHTQYALLAGRAGGQVQIGGTAASDSYTAKSTSNSTKGDLIWDDHQVWWPSEPNDASSGILSAVTWSPTFTLSGTGINVGLQLSPTVTISSNHFFRAIRVDGTFTSTVSPFSNWEAVQAAPFIISNTAAVAPMATQVFTDEPFFQCNAAVSTGSGLHTGFHSTPNFNATVSGATLNISSILHFNAAGVLTAASGATTAIITRTCYKVNELTLTGAGTKTLVNNIGLDIAALTQGSTLIAGIRSAIASGTGKFFIQETGGAAWSAAGKFTTYNNIATAGWGVPGIHDVVNATAQTADIADTNFANTGVTGFYRVEVYLVDTTAAAGAGTVTCNIKWNDGAAAQTATVGPVTLVTLGAFAQATFFIRRGSGNITYGVTHTGIFSTAQYALYATAERLN